MGVSGLAARIRNVLDPRSVGGSKHRIALLRPWSGSRPAPGLLLAGAEICRVARGFVRGARLQRSCVDMAFGCRFKAPPSLLRISLMPSIARTQLRPTITRLPVPASVMRPFAAVLARSGGRCQVSGGAAIYRRAVLHR